MTLHEIAKFEQQNPDFSVNVYKLDKNIDKDVKLIPLYSTPERNRKYHAQLLQIENIRKLHYVVISNMNGLLFDQTSDRRKTFVIIVWLCFRKNPTSKRTNANNTDITF